MRIHGKISHWNHEKGYGFITAASGKDVFVHLRAFSNRDHQPAIEQRVTFTLSKDNQGRPCAAQVALLGDKPARQARSGGHKLYLVIAGAFLLIVATSVALAALPPVVLLVYLGASLLTFLAYAWDKDSAQRGGWRTKESTLHLLSLLGGWPGAMVAQQVLRHKSRKEDFRFVFWLTVVINCGMFLSLFTEFGKGALDALLS